MAKQQEETDTIHGACEGFYLFKVNYIGGWAAATVG